jgi:protein tyrosine phosphatase
MIKIKKKKVLVHCHAGNGRTGIVVACYLIYTYNYDAENAVKVLRSFRKKCIEKNAQMKYCIKFKQFIVQLRRIFTSEKYDVDYFIKHQSDLSMEDSHKKIFIPKIIWICFDILNNLKVSNTYTNKSIYKALNGSLEISENEYQELINIVDEINDGIWDSLQNNKKIVIVCELLYYWLEDCVTYCISPKKINEIFYYNNFKILIVDIINGNCDQRIIKSISEHIENNLKKLEMEIIKYITSFLCKIYSNEEDNNVIEFKRMVEKISIYLLGFNIDLLLYFKSKSDENKIDEEIEDDYDLGIQISIKECIQSIENLILIFEFLRIKYTHSTNKTLNNNLLSLNSKDNYLKHLDYKKMNETLRSVITSQDESNDGSFVNQKLTSSKGLNYEKNDKNNRLNLSILQGKEYKNQIKKSCSPIKSHLIHLQHGKKIKNTITPFRNKFLDFKKVSNTINKSPTLKPKSPFSKALNLNDSKLVLKNYNNENIPVIKINYVEKND